MAEENETGEREAPAVEAPKPKATPKPGGVAVVDLHERVSRLEREVLNKPSPEAPDDSDEPPPLDEKSDNGWWW